MNWRDFWNQDTPIYVSERLKVLHYWLIANDIARPRPPEGCGCARSTAAARPFRRAGVASRAPGSISSTPPRSSGTVCASGSRAASASRFSRPRHGFHPGPRRRSHRGELARAIPPSTSCAASLSLWRSRAEGRRQARPGGRSAARREPSRETPGRSSPSPGKAGSCVMRWLAWFAPPCPTTARSAMKLGLAICGKRDAGDPAGHGLQRRKAPPERQP